MVHLSRKWLICFFSLYSTFIPSHSFANENIKDSSLIPITTVFYGMDRNFISSLSYNYGLNYLLAGAGTYGIVKSGIDWSWYRNAQDHKWISQIGFMSVGVGPLASVAVPVGLYIYGRSNENYKLQVTGLAVGQAAILAALTTSVFKAFTGRVRRTMKPI